MGSHILLKIVSENQFSEKTHFYTIASRAGGGGRGAPLHDQASRQEVLQEGLREEGHFCGGFFCRVDGTTVGNRRVTISDENAFLSKKCYAFTISLVTIP